MESEGMRERAREKEKEREREGEKSRKERKVSEHECEGREIVSIEFKHKTHLSLSLSLSLSQPDNGLISTARAMFPVLLKVAETHRHGGYSGRSRIRSQLENQRGPPFAQSACR